jgi:hypothetical protein
MRFKNKIRSRFVLWISIICTTLFSHHNRGILFVYYNYAQYKLSSGINDSTSNISRTINAAKEAGYTCENNNAPVIFAVKEIQKRTKRRAIELIDYSQVSKSNCTILPTGEIFIIISNGTVRHYIVLEKDVQTAEMYHILDIKGEAIG